MWGVMRFYNLIRAGVTWKGPEVIELWHNSNETNKTFSSLQEETKLNNFNINIRDNDEDDGGNETDDILIESDNDNNDKSAGSGSDEDDSLLVAYDSNSIVSVWQYNKTVKFRLKGLTGYTMVLFVFIFLIEIYAQIVLIFWMMQLGWAIMWLWNAVKCI